MGTIISNIMLRIDQLDRTKKIKILLILCLVTVGSIVYGHLGPSKVHYLRYIGYAMTLPTIFFIAALARKRLHNSNDGNATQATTMHQGPSYPLATTEGANIPPPYPPVAGPQGANTLPYPNNPYPPQQTAVYPQSGSKGYDNPPQETNTSLPYPPYPPVAGPNTFSYPDQQGINPYPSTQPMYPTNGYTGSSAPPLPSGTAQYPGQYPEPSMPPPPSYDDAVKR